MFNTFLTNIINSYLGEIVEDLDIDNIGSGAINGDILLIDLKLRPDALVRTKTFDPSIRITNNAIILDTLD